MFCSYTLIQLTVRGFLYHNTYLFAFYYLMVGYGSAAQIVTGSGTNSKNFSAKRKGLVLATVLLFFGLSGAVLSPLYNLFKGPTKLADYYTFLSILGLVLPCVNAMFHTHVPLKTEPKKVSEEQIQEYESEIIPLYGEKKEVFDLKDTTTFEMFFTLRFYLVFLTWGITSGSGLLFINNLGEIIVSNNGPVGKI
jgi:MFS family permease